MTIKYENSLDWFDNDDKSRVFQLIPDCFHDNRGYFMEVLKESDNNKIPDWLKNLNWIKQINRSSSSGGVIRGCHAQKGKYCQGKLVEAVTGVIYDIITDARPDSKTFGTTEIFILDPVIHNKLWVPRGFLHSFAVPFSTKKNVIFEYYCDNVYNHASETGVNPETLLPFVVKTFKELFGESEEYDPLYKMFLSSKKNTYSDKDMKAMDYKTFIDKVENEYNTTGKVWYK